MKRRFVEVTVLTDGADVSEEDSGLEIRLLELSEADARALLSSEIEYLAEKEGLDFDDSTRSTLPNLEIEDLIAIGFSLGSELVIVEWQDETKEELVKRILEMIAGEERGWTAPTVGLTTDSQHSFSKGLPHLDAAPLLTSASMAIMAEQLRRSGSIFMDDGVLPGTRQSAGPRQPKPPIELGPNPEDRKK